MWPQGEYGGILPWVMEALSFGALYTSAVDIFPLICATFPSPCFMPMARFIKIRDFYLPFPDCTGQTELVEVRHCYEPGPSPPRSGMVFPAFCCSSYTFSSACPHLFFSLEVLEQKKIIAYKNHVSKHHTCFWSVYENISDVIVVSSRFIY